MMSEFRAIPGWAGMYEVSRDGRVRSLARVIWRCNGTPYRVVSRVLRPNTHYPSGLQSVTLACDHRQYTVYINKLVREVFVDLETHSGTTRLDSAS